MDGTAREELRLLDGGRGPGAPRRAGSAGHALRVIAGGPAGEPSAALEEPDAATRALRQEIEARMARALEELFPQGERS